MDYFDIMDASCSSIGVNFDKEKYDKFIIYMKKLKDWNEKINLTAITEEEQIIKKHFIDSLKALGFAPLKSAEKIIDVGTGAGFPGIPIKIIEPHSEVVLLDSLNKRVNFLNEVIQSIELKGITAIHGRAEDFARKVEFREKFDIAISRAVANMAVLSELCIPYVKVGGYFLAMKGPAIDEEIGEARNAIGLLGGKIEEIIKVNIEDSDLKHNLVVVKKVKSTSKTYPRKAGNITKKPLK